MPEKGRIYGVFVWVVTGVYPSSSAVRTFAVEKNAQKWADKENATGDKNYVVRTIYLR